MRVVVTGATGLIGRALVARLVSDGVEVVALTRRPRQARAALPSAARVVRWNDDAGGAWVKHLVGADAVVHLGGASIGSRPWTAGRRREILASRVRSTEAIVSAIESLSPADRPKALISASGMDYYGDRPSDEPITESSSPGTSFLAGVCRDWEARSMRAEVLGVRVALMRTGFVVDRAAPAFRLLALPSRLGLGARLGTGEQRFTWVHLRDVVGLFRLAIADAQIHGPVNLIAPEVPRQSDVVREMARSLHRPAPLRIPERLLRLAINGQADLLLHGRSARPIVALEHGYEFAYPTLSGALREAFGARRSEGRVESKSPFERAFAPGERPLLAPALQTQFLTSEGVVTLSGEMTRVWRRQRWLAPAFRVMAPLHILFAETGRDVPMTLTIRPSRDRAGRPIQRWEREFRFPEGIRRFDATLSYDPDLGQTVERTGPNGMFESVWRTLVVPSGLIIEAEGLRLRIGSRRVRLPRVLGVTVRVEERIDAEHLDRISVNLSLTHSVLGALFGYEGVVIVKRR